MAPVFRMEVETANEEMKHQCREFVFSEEQQGTSIEKICNNLHFKARVAYGTNKVA